AFNDPKHHPSMASVTSVLDRVRQSSPALHATNHHSRPRKHVPPPIATSTNYVYGPPHRSRRTNHHGHRVSLAGLDTPAPTPASGPNRKKRISPSTPHPSKQGGGGAPHHYRRRHRADSFYASRRRAAENLNRIRAAEEGVDPAARLDLGRDRLFDLMVDLGVTGNEFTPVTREDLLHSEDGAGAWEPADSEEEEELQDYMTARAAGHDGGNDEQYHHQQPNDGEGFDIWTAALLSGQNNSSTGSAGTQSPMPVDGSEPEEEVDVGGDADELDRDIDDAFQDLGL
ncbi:hypothetical protein HK101_009751, partial [Irineochytrium annulatum]